MRHRILVDSVRRHLGPDATVGHVVFMWRRPIWAIAGAVIAAAIVYALVSLTGYGSPSTAVGLALATAVLVTVMATESRVLAQTSDGLLLFAASRIRQVAVRSLGEVSADATIEVITSNLLITEWSVDGERYSVPRRSQSAMARLADRS